MTSGTDSSNIVSRTALIVGAGIGGLSAGLALRQAGWNIRIFERESSPRELGVTITEGTIVRWFKRVGDTVERDEALFEIETDKAYLDITAPASGVLTEIRFAEKLSVPVRTVVAVIRQPRTPIWRRLVAQGSDFMTWARRNATERGVEEIEVPFCMLRSSMPQNRSDAQITIRTWLKEPGDWVQQNEPVVELEIREVGNDAERRMIISHVTGIFLEARFREGRTWTLADWPVVLGWIQERWLPLKVVDLVRSKLRGALLKGGQ